MTLDAVNSLPSTDTLLSTLSGGGVVITATQRLARHLIQQVALEDSSVMHKPAIVSLESWLIDTWTRVEECRAQPRRLLTTAEATELWRRIIDEHAQSEGAFSLLQSESAAQLASRCRVALKGHGVSLAYEANRKQFQSEIDTKNFLNWVDALDAKLMREHWLLLEDTYELIAQYGEKASGEVLFLSEEAPGPALSAALVKCFSRGTWHHSASVEERLETHVFETRSDELIAAARWGKTQFERGDSAVIVLMDYHRDRAQLEQCLRTEFDVGGLSFTQLPVNFSRGVELSKTPLYRDALLLLRLITQSANREDVLALVRSPFFRWSRPADKASVIRALFDTQERQFSRHQVFAQLSRLTTNAGLTEALNWARVERLSVVRHTSAEWREVLVNLLSRAGWPGAAGIDSVEFQQYEQFSDVLDMLEINPLDKAPFTLTRFLEKLSYSLTQRIFQPQTEASPLQVMSLRDTFGLAFKSARVVGAVSESLPNPPQLLSLIPWQICHEYNIRSAFETESEVISGRLLGRLDARANLTLSYSFAVDGLESLPSRFCAAPLPVEALVRESAPFVTHAAEEIMDNVGCEVVPPANQAGGVGLLEDQALCPLKAHLKHRLSIRALQEEQTGLSPGERGALLHSALFHTFGELSSSDALASIEWNQQLETVERSVEKAVSGIKSSIRDRVGLPMLDLERMRLRTTVENWLSIEAKRSVPFKILQREETYQWQWEGLTLSFKVDRVDQLTDEGLMVIDYKSKTSNSLADWTRRPIKAPQLPCYSEVIDEVIGVAVAAVTGEKAGYRPLGAEMGIGRNDQVAQKELQEEAGLSWSALRNQWRDELSRLVAEFMRGEAKATPSAKACRYCDYALICRVRSLSNGDEGMDASTDD